jgi:predicted cation transporter
MDGQRDETPAEKMDRNWSELLQELRVTQTGVQILSGFLLTLPFQSRFTHLERAQEGTYLAAVVLATIATGMLVAPVSAHRLLFRHHEKDVLVDAGDGLAKAGLAALGLTITAVLGLIFSVVVGTTAAVSAAVASLAFFILTWVVLPLAIQRKSTRAA